LSKVNAWREIAALGLVLMNLSWLIPWFQAFTRVTTYPTAQVTLVIGVILLVAYIAGRGTTSLRLKTEVQVALIGVLVLCSVLWSLSVFIPDGNADQAGSISSQALRGWGEVFSVVPRELLVIVALLFVWWWGLRLSRERIGPYMMIKYFQIGSLLLLLYAAVVADLVGYHPPPWIYILFLFSGLIAMGCARISVVGSLRGGRRSPFNPRWLGEILLAAVITLVLAAVLAVLFTNQSERIAGWLEGLVYIVGLIIASPIILILSLLAGWLNRMDSASVEVVPQTEVPLEEAEGFTPSGLPLINEGGIAQANLLPMLRLVLTWVLVILAVYLLYRFLRHTAVLMRKRRAEVADDPSAYSGLGGLGQLLREVLFGQARQVMGGLQRLNRRERLMAAERIRNIYAQLLELSGQLGHARLAAQTPLEFLPELEHYFTGCGDDLQVITAAYIDIRYGELPETHSQLQAVESAWRRVQSCGEARQRDLKASQKAEQSGSRESSKA